jgi:hypothetical protein
VDVKSTENEEGFGTGLGQVSKAAQVLRGLRGSKLDAFRQLSIMSNMHVTPAYAVSLKHPAQTRKRFDVSIGRPNKDLVAGETGRMVRPLS